MKIKSKGYEGLGLPERKASFASTSPIEDNKDWKGGGSQCERHLDSQTMFT
jgi:hypothetical protein